MQEIAGSMWIGPMIAAGRLRPYAFERDRPHERLVRTTQRSPEASVAVEVRRENTRVDPGGGAIAAAERKLLLEGWEQDRIAVVPEPGDAHRRIVGVEAD